MPTISVPKAELYRRLGKQYTTEDFDELCFLFGIELDDDTTEEVNALKAKGLPSGEPELKIEIPANRYDLLCTEGLARGLRVFLGLEEPPHYTLSTPSVIQDFYVEASTSPLRPCFSSAILRLAKPMDSLAYDSFIALQDKLHQNLCRQRRLVAIGTHDLDTITGPFRYMCRSPKDIKFAPLNKDTSYTAEELMEVYATDRHLGRYLPIIRDAPAYPIIYDKDDRVLSMPPIINSQHSKIVAGRTQNILLDVTGTDPTKVAIVANMICAMFSEYCAVPFEVEPVRLHFPDGKSSLVPDIGARKTTASVSYINAACGLSLSPAEICKLLRKMSHIATPSADPDVLDVEVPCTRPDILHEADLMEDVAIAYGFNNLPKAVPATNTVAKPFAVNRLGDIIRKEAAYAGWIEALPLILCSHAENFDWLNRKDPGGYAITTANPATAEFQIIRTSLLPGLLKTLRENRAVPLPIKVFEVSDVAIQDPSAERQARNYRRLGAVYTDKKAGFENVHGLLDRIMLMLGVPFLERKENPGKYGYYIAASSDATYFPGRGAKVFLRPKPSIPREDVADPTPKPSAPQSALESVAQTLKSALPGVGKAGAEEGHGGDLEIGSLGILHPSVLEKFELGRPCSALEIDVEPLL